MAVHGLPGVHRLLLAEWTGEVLFRSFYDASEPGPIKLPYVCLAKTESHTAAEPQKESCLSKPVGTLETDAHINTLEV